MRSLKVEQIAVIKFLTLEGHTQTEIFSRLKNVFSTFTLSKEKVKQLHCQFLQRGLLGLKEEPPYEECISEISPSIHSSHVEDFDKREMNDFIKTEIDERHYSFGEDNAKNVFNDDEDEWQREQDQVWNHKPKHKKLIRANQTQQKSHTTQKEEDADLNSSLMDFDIEEDGLEHTSLDVKPQKGKINKSRKLGMPIKP